MADGDKSKIGKAEQTAHLAGLLGKGSFIFMADQRASLHEGDLKWSQVLCIKNAIEELMWHTTQVPSFPLEMMMLMI